MRERERKREREREREKGAGYRIKHILNKSFDMHYTTATEHFIWQLFSWYWRKQNFCCVLSFSLSSELFSVFTMTVL